MKKAIQYLTLLCAIFALPALTSGQVTQSFTFTTNRLVPDGDFAGLSDVETISSTITSISSLHVRLKIVGEYNGDLYAYLRHSNGFCILLNRPGKTLLNANGYADSGLNITFDPSAANGDVHVYENVLTPTAGNPLTGSWIPDGRNVDPTTVIDLTPITTSLANFTSLNANGDWTLYVADLQSGGSNMLASWGLDITGASLPVITWANPPSITYGAALSSSQLNATATFNGTNVPGNFSYSLGLGSILNAGNNQTIGVTFTPSNTASFLSVTTNITLSVLPATLTLTASNAQSIYGSSIPTLGLSYSGFVNGDSLLTLLSLPSVSTGASSSSPAGSYPITVSGGSALNYAISYVAGTLTVLPATLSVAAVNTNKVYGAIVPGLSAIYSGFVNGDTTGSLTTLPSISTAVTASTGVGSYPITLSGGVSSNYSFNLTPGSLTVSAAPLTITASNATRVYGASNPSFSVNYSGFVLGQTLSALTTLPVVSTAANALSAPGVYSLTPAGAVDPNYSISYANGQLTITDASTSGNLTSSPNPATPGGAVTFTETVGPVFPGTGTPTGNVVFRVDGSPVSTNTLTSGVATFSTHTLTHGSHSVLAQYVGDSNFVGITNSLAQSQVINTAPLAQNVSITRTPDAAAKITVAALLANASDADGDTLTLSVSPLSQSNSPVMISGGWVIYTPLAGFTNSDSFSYTVTDSFGATATAQVTITVAGPNAPGQNLTIASGSNGTVTISGNGIPGYTYHIQYSDVIAPYSWQPLTNGTVTANSVGQFQVTDTSGSQSRFYRSVYP